MVDRCGQVLEEPLQGSRVVGVEGRSVWRAELRRRLLEPAGIAAGEDDIGTLGPGAPGCLEPDTCAAADDDDGLSGQFRFALGRTPVMIPPTGGAGYRSPGRRRRLRAGIPHCSPHFGSLAICAAIGLAGGGMSATFMRSAFKAAS